MCNESYVQRELPFLKLLNSLPVHGKSKILLKCKGPQIYAISEITDNFLKRNLTTDRKIIKRLRPFKTLLKRISSKKESIKKKRKILSSRKGGSLLSMLLPLVSSIFSL